MFKRLLILVILITIHIYNAESRESVYSEASFSSLKDEYFLHTVERGETVYSISVMYGVSVDSIYQLNPNSKNGIKAGETLKIPQKAEEVVYHTIEPKETLYSLSKKYNISGEDIIAANPGLSVQTFTIGKTIMIPIYKERSIGPNQASNVDESENKVNNLLKQQQSKKNVGVINIGLLLSFGTVDKDSVPASHSQRFIEYYEGFLLALDSLKRTGVSVNLNVYDIGFRMESLNKILKNEDLKSNHLIIGGGTDEQISKISAFSKTNAIRYVIPFSSKIDETLSNPYVFQINTPQSYLYSKVSQSFVKKYNTDKIIFIKMSSQNDKMELLQTMQTDLAAEGHNYSELTYNASTFGTDIKKELSNTSQNILVLSSGTPESLLRVITPLRNMRDSEGKKIISLFGFPEWQTYAKDYMDDFFSTGTCIYSVFYANNTQPEVKNFYNVFKGWYGKNVINSYPKYAMLGYDTGLYFIQMIKQYGANFETSLDKFQYQSLQTGFNFTRVNTWGGFINTNIYFVNFQPDFSIVREIAK